MTWAPRLARLLATSNPRPGWREISWDRESPRGHGTWTRASYDGDSIREVVEAKEYPCMKWKEDIGLGDQEFFKIFLKL